MVGRGSAGTKETGWWEATTKIPKGHRRKDIPSIQFDDLQAKRAAFQGYCALYPTRSRVKEIMRINGMKHSLDELRRLMTNTSWSSEERKKVKEALRTLSDWSGTWTKRANKRKNTLAWWTNHGKLKKTKLLGTGTCASLPHPLRRETTEEY